MLKFGASQHFQEVSHEPPGTERGEKCVGDAGWSWVVHVCVCCMYTCDMCESGWCHGEDRMWEYWMVWQMSVAGEAW